MIEEQFPNQPGKDEPPRAGPLFRRRDITMALVAAPILMAGLEHVAAQAIIGNLNEGTNEMNYVTTSEEIQIFYKDWGPKSAQPIMFHHGWPLSSDDWDAQMLYFLSKGYRVIAHDRRGHGRSTQVSDGHDMNHYAADVAAVVEHLNLRNVIHIGHSTGGGEAAHYVAKHGQDQGRVAKLVLIGAVPPIMLKTPNNPGGIPIEVFDGLREQLAANRAQFYHDFASGPFYGFNRSDVKLQEIIARNWWRQAMMGAANAHYLGIKAFSETDFTDDLKSITVPTLVMHGEDDQIVPIEDSAILSDKLLKNSTLQTYPGYPHGMCTTHANVINPDLLKFIQS
ncbi:MAG: alpha/beta hydrolase [Rhodobacteraceae bacterium]|nr:alpha/beta hydrolase [Paracoccaceae bacterium]